MRATLSHSNSTREASKNYFTPLLTLFLLWIVFLASRPKLRGRLQRHRTRGGRRWPRGGCETHIRGAAAQAAGSRCASRVSRGKGGRCIRGAFPRAHRPSLTAVGRCWTPSHEKRGRRLKGQPTGGSAEQASNTARGTPGSRRPVATTACAPFKSDVHRVMGRSAPRRSAHPRFSSRMGMQPRLRANPAPAKQHGRRSVGCLKMELPRS